MYTIVLKLIRTHVQAATAQPQRRIYLTLYEQLKAMIEAGILPEGSVMPPTRLLCEELGLARSTVVKSYNLLTENHLLRSRQGSGYVVVRAPRKAADKPPAPESYPAISQFGQAFLHNIHTLTHTNSEGLAFTPGLPPVDVFPVGQWQKLTNTYWRTIKSQDLNYSISSGIDTLKESIANYLRLSRRLHCDPSHIIIVSGSLQSLFLLGSVLVDPGNAVAVENPTFPNVISIFSSLRADIQTLGADAEGTLVPEAGQGYPPKIVHVTPSNLYPLGGTMSVARRRQLLQWASDHDALIIENDYEHEINNWYQPTEAIFSLDRQQRTIYLGTFNRLLHPSIRLGYMVLPPYLLPAIKALQMHSHRFVPQSIQVVMTDFINQYIIYRHVRHVIQEAEDRKAHFLQQFARHFGGSLHIRLSETPSFHLVAEMADVLDAPLVQALEARGIVTHGLSHCYIGEAQRQGLILGYSGVNNSFASAALARMAAVYKGFKS